MFERNSLNDLYYPLCEKAELIKARLVDDGVSADIRWYNNNSHFTQEGFYETDCFPIPVVEAEGLFDVTLDFDTITIISKLSKQSAVDLDYSIFDGYSFDVYGSDDYLGRSFYSAETGISGIIDNIRSCNDKDIVFCVSLDFDVRPAKLFKLMTVILDNGFYY